MYNLSSRYSNAKVNTFSRQIKAVQSTTRFIFSINPFPFIFSLREQTLARCGDDTNEMEEKQDTSR